MLQKLFSVKKSSEQGFEEKCSVPNQQNLWKAHDSKLRNLIEFLSPLKKISIPNCCYSSYKRASPRFLKCSNCYQSVLFVTKVPSFVTKVPSFVTKVPFLVTKVPSLVTKLPSLVTKVPVSGYQSALRVLLKFPIVTKVPY